MAVSNLNQNSALQASMLVVAIHHCTLGHVLLLHIHLIQVGGSSRPWIPVYPLRFF